MSDPKPSLLVLSLALSPVPGCDKSNEAPQAPEQTDSIAAEPPQTTPTTSATELPITDSATQKKIQTALTADHRTPEDKARDDWRHPLDTLSFFGLRDDMTVLELWPGTGWYTDILGPVLRERGQLVVTNFSTEGPADSYRVRNAKTLAAKLAQQTIYGNVQVRTIDPPASIDLGPDASVDMVVTFRNSHGWVREGYEEKVYGEAFRVLEPGGILGVVQHRAAPGVDDVKKHAETGYVPEDYLTQKIESIGFRLVDKSEVNANPKDTKDHLGGVWALPPTFQNKDKDKAKYAAIGESDRMTLRFVKPKG